MMCIFCVYVNIQLEKNRGGGGEGVRPCLRNIAVIGGGGGGGGFLISVDYGVCKNTKKMITQYVNDP